MEKLRRRASFGPPRFDFRFRPLLHHNASGKSCGVLMRRIVAPLLPLLVACALASAGCRGAGKGTAESKEPGGSDAGEVIKALGAFTEELASKVETAEDTKAGLVEAQKLLDARKDELAT